MNLRNIYLFGHLSDERLAEVEQELEHRQLEPGDILFHKGDEGDSLMIVNEGQVAVYEPSEENAGNEQPIRIFTAGDAFGEMALIDNQPRSLSARAVQTAEVLVLSKANFHRFIREDDDLSLAVMAGLSDRIRYTTEFLNEVRSWVGRISAGEYQFANQVKGWVEHMEEGEYEEAAEAARHYQDESLADLAADFAKMASRVAEREQELRQEIAELKIEIDEGKREREVKEIKESEFFQSLKSKVKEMREDD